MFEIIPRVILNNCLNCKLNYRNYFLLGISIWTPAGGPLLLWTSSAFLISGGFFSQLARLAKTATAQMYINILICKLNKFA